MRREFLKKLGVGLAAVPATAEAAHQAPAQLFESWLEEGRLVEATFRPAELNDVAMTVALAEFQRRTDAPIVEVVVAPKLVAQYFRSIRPDRHYQVGDGAMSFGMPSVMRIMSAGFDAKLTPSFDLPRGLVVIRGRKPYAA
jgi:hypothetical protein